MVYTCNVKANLKGLEEVKSSVEMNVFCIVGQDHQRLIIVEDHTITLKTI